MLVVFVSVYRRSTYFGVYDHTLFLVREGLVIIVSGGGRDLLAFIVLPLLVRRFVLGLRGGRVRRFLDIEHVEVLGAGFGGSGSGVASHGV